MILHFGTDFDGIVYTHLTSARAGETWIGPRKLLQWLERQLGMSGYADNTDYLRIELYRQAMGQYLAECEQQPLLQPLPFYAASFGADRFASAATLLYWRDELLLAGWDFEENATMPERLRCFAAIEILYRNKISDPAIRQQVFGFADRFAAVLEQAENGHLPLQKLVLYQPEHCKSLLFKDLSGYSAGET